MNSILVHQHETFERSTTRWVGFGIGVLLLMVLSFAAPLRIHDGYAGSVGSWSNRLNAIILLIIVGCYVYAAIVYNKKVTITYDDRGVLSREGKQRVQLQQFASYSLTHHGSKDQYYTLFLLNTDGYIEKLLPFADSSEHINEFIDYVEEYLTPTEKVNLHWYEKVQRGLKI